MDNDMDVMARTIYGEAKANDVKDATAIAHVILNRVAYRNWPNNVNDVCMQPRQFSCWDMGDPNRERILDADGPWFDKCIDIAREAYFSDDPTDTATHYHTPKVRPSWSRGKTPCYETDGHVFFNDIDTKKPLHQSRTVQGGAGAAVGGAAITVDSVVEIARGAAVLDLGSIMQVAIGLAIVGFAAYTIYARWDDRRNGRG